MSRELTVQDMEIPRRKAEAVLVRPDDENATPYWSLLTSDGWSVVCLHLTQPAAARLGAHLLLGRVEAVVEALERAQRDGCRCEYCKDTHCPDCGYDAAREALSDIRALLPAHKHGDGTYTSACSECRA